MTLEARTRLAREVFDALDVSAPALRLIAGTLAAAGGPLAQFADALDFHADVLEDPAVSGTLATLRLARDLRVVASRPDAGELLERLDGLEQPPWPELRAALEQLVTSPNDAEEAP